MTDYCSVEKKLNKLFVTNSKAYQEYLDLCHSTGLTVLRNSQGYHVVNNNESFLDTAFGGIFRRKL